jgi:cupin domain
MATRRVVTGHTVDGTSVFVSDEALEPLTSPDLAGAGMTYLWGADAPQQYPNDGAQPEWRGHFPALGGYRLLVFSMPPAGDESVWQQLHPDKELSDATSKYPGLADAFDDEPGMHTTDSTDFGIILSGEVVLELDDGAARTLSAGDVVVQNGTRHRWTNRSAQPAEIAFVLIGAPPRVDP